MLATQKFGRFITSTDRYPKMGDQEIECHLLAEGICRCFFMAAAM